MEANWYLKSIDGVLNATLKAEAVQVEIVPSLSDRVQAKFSFREDLGRDVLLLSSVTSRIRTLQISPKFPNTRIGSQAIRQLSIYRRSLETVVLQISTPFTLYPCTLEFYNAMHSQNVETIKVGDRIMIEFLEFPPITSSDKISTTLGLALLVVKRSYGRSCGFWSTKTLLWDWKDQIPAVDHRLNRNKTSTFLAELQASLFLSRFIEEKGRFCLIFYDLLSSTHRNKINFSY